MATIICISPIWKATQSPKTKKTQKTKNYHQQQKTPKKLNMFFNQVPDLVFHNLYVV